jgi:hypothetical protein
MGVHVMRQVNAGSPGSDGASPYLPPNRARARARYRSRGRSLRAAGEKRWKDEREALARALETIRPKSLMGFML